MKKLIILILVGISAIQAQAQTWKTVKLDSAVSVKLPFAHSTRDTLGQKVLISKLAMGDIQIIVNPDNPHKTPDIEKKRHLLKFYDTYRKKIESSSASGKITEEKDTMLGDLYVKDFTLEVDSGTGKQLRDFRILHENGATYTFQLLYKDLHKEYIKADRNTFFSSIKVANNPELQSQFTATDGQGSNNNRLYFMGGSVLVIALLVLVIVRSRKKPVQTG